jgi:putative ABC transport system permease protein
VQELHDRLLGQLRAVPGIEAVSASVGLPPDVFGSNSDFFPVRNPPPDGAFSPLADDLSIDGDYFAVLGVPLLAGRVFDTRDGPNAPQTVIISAELARRYFQRANPIGERVSVGGTGPANEYTIVGVVGNVPYDGVARGASAALYFPFAQYAMGITQNFSVVIRTAETVDDVTATLRAAMRQADPEVAVAQVRTVRELVDTSVAADRFRTTLLGLFALLALALAGVGIYGVMAFSVGRRTREIGVRIAMGARRRQLYAQILREGLAVAGVGIAVGLVGAVAATRVLSKLLYQVSATDALTFGVVPALLLGIAALACLVPAHRATRVDPAITMIAD